MEAPQSNRDTRIRILTAKLVAAHEVYLTKMRALRQQQAELLKKVVARIEQENIDRIRSEITTQNPS